jgi:carbon-monoxide dehydrogenase small subunit
MLAEAFLAEQPEPTEEEVREVVAANLCRCTGYQGIVEAVKETAQSRRERARG